MFKDSPKLRWEEIKNFDNNQDEIELLIRKHFDLRPKSLINALNLKRPIYQDTAAYGHFGRPPTADGHFSWEKTDLVEELKKVF